MNATQAIEIPKPNSPPLKLATLPKGPMKVRLLMDTFHLSLSVVVAASRKSGGRSLSKSTLHRVIHGKKPSPGEKQAIAVAIVECLKDRCADSAFLFGD